VLEGYLGDPSFFARISAAQALGKLGRSQAVPALQRVARADVDRRIQLSARAALEKLKEDSRNPESWNTLQCEVRTLREDNQGLRKRLDRLESLIPSMSKAGARRGKSR
jgi:HEAT repeat protein